MSKLGRNQKVLRVVRFMMGLRLPGAYSKLVDYGLTEEVLAEGQELLRRATFVQLGRRPPGKTATLLPQLDVYENHWFPIIRAVLRRHHPSVLEWLFNNISQSTGLDLVVTVDTVLRRMREAQAGHAPEAEQGVEAMELLGQRGFSEERLAEGEALIDKVSAFQGETQIGSLEAEAEVEQAKEALWAWYLEWSAIVRQVITDRAVLRRLGFRSRTGSASLNGEGDAKDTVDENAAEPAASASEREARAPGADAAPGEAQELDEAPTPIESAADEISGIHDAPLAVLVNPGRKGGAASNSG